MRYREFLVTRWSRSARDSGHVPLTGRVNRVIGGFTPSGSVSSTTLPIFRLGLLIQLPRKRNHSCSLQHHYIHNRLSPASQGSQSPTITASLSRSGENRSVRVATALAIRLVDARVTASSVSLCISPAGKGRHHTVRRPVSDQREVLRASPSADADSS